MKKLSGFFLLILSLLFFSISSYAAEKASPTDVALKWSFSTPTPEGPNGEPPSQKVSLIVGQPSKEIAIGNYQGNCTEMTPEKQASFKIALSGISCWWAGSGSDIIVVKTSVSTLSVKERSVDEGAGFGKWTIITTVPLSKESKVPTQQ